MAVPASVIVVPPERIKLSPSLIVVWSVLVPTVPYVKPVINPINVSSPSKNVSSVAVIATKPEEVPFVIVISP